MYDDNHDFVRGWRGKYTVIWSEDGEKKAELLEWELDAECAVTHNALSGIPSILISQNFESVEKYRWEDIAEKYIDYLDGRIVPDFCKELYHDWCEATGESLVVEIYPAISRDKLLKYFSDEEIDEMIEESLEYSNPGYMWYWNMADDDIDVIAEHRGGYIKDGKYYPPDDDTAHDISDLLRKP